MLVLFPFFYTLFTFWLSDVREMTIDLYFYHILHKLWD